MCYNSALGRMVIKFTYGERIWEEMGDVLVPWNVENMDLINEAFFGVWPVDFFHFCTLWWIINE
jgi:hypothetical protein